jgi:hypothetical protein
VGPGLLQKRKKQKTTNPQFQIIKKKRKNPHIGSTNQTQFGLDSGYFKESIYRKFYRKLYMENFTLSCSPLPLLARLPAYRPASLATIKPSSLPSSHSNPRDLCIIVLPCFETYKFSFYSPGA